MRNLVLIVATGAGSGYAPFAPGTVGSALGLALYLSLAWGLGWGNPAMFAVTLATIALACWAAGRAEELFGTRDDGRITVDEVAGMFTALLFLPAAPEVWLSAFLLFRLFDVWKPFPVRSAERLSGGLGVVADDLIAGLYANLVAQLIWRVAFPGALL